MKEMLIWLEKVCNEQGITWCMDGGTLLGAVRHGGFIPWDDDVDVIMERKDYRKFIKFMRKNPSTKYVLQTRKSDKGFYDTWAVLRDLRSEYIQDSSVHNIREYRGLQIDVFPIQPESIPLLHKIAKKGNTLIHAYLIGHSRWLVGLFSFLVNDIMCPTFRLLTSIIKKNKKHFSYQYGCSFTNTTYRYSDVFPTKEILFEGIELPGPCHADRYLTTLYGEDYMNLPPVDQRGAHDAKYAVWD